MSGVGQRWAKPATTYADRGLCSRAYLDALDVARQRVMTLYVVGEPINDVISIARRAYRAAWEAEKARARGDG